VTLTSVARNACCSPDAVTYLMMFSDAAKQWRPTRKIDSQWQYHGSNINDDGTIPTTVPLPNTFATTGGNNFGTQPQILAPVDPRLRDQTSFNYVSGNGSLSSTSAKVTIMIEPENRPPIFASTPPIRHNGTLSYQARAVDSDIGDTVTYSLIWHTASTVCSITAAGGLLACTGIDVNPVNSQASPYYVIAATDSFGATALQSFQVQVATGSCNVPNTVGQTVAAASSAIVIAGCAVGSIEESYASTPSGQVVATFPTANTVILGGEAVSLSVSKGPPPVVVPLVVGKSQSVATSKLSAVGFTPSVTYEYSSSSSRGLVLNQTPAAGAFVSPPTASISVSLGNGLSLQLSQDALTAGKSATVNVVRTGLNGIDAPYAGAALSIVSVGGTATGAAPTVSGNTVNTSATTRGVFRITAVDAALSVSASADFIVNPPDTITSNIDFAAIARSTEVIESVRTLLVSASNAPDLATTNARVLDAVNLWRSFDQWVLRRSTPAATETGFPFNANDLIAAGESATIEDQLAITAWERSVKSLESLVAQLQEPSTTLPALDARVAELSEVVGDIAQMSPTKFGLVSAQAEHTAIVTTLVPDMMDALMNDLGKIVGLSPEAPKRRGAQKSTLGEALVTLAVNKSLEMINTAKQLQNAAMKSAKQGAALLALAGQLRTALAGDSLEAVVSGASLSFRLFGVPNAFIEGNNFELKYPYLNDIVMIGPEAVDKVLDASSAIASLGSAQSLGAAIYALYDVRKKLGEVVSTADGVFANGLQKVRQAERSCFFSSAAACGQLVVRDGGFDSVYEYRVINEFFQVDSLPIPLPIITIVRSPVSGRFSFATPAFLPTKKALSAPP
jgi:beta-lactam-binding protein with PASTA domain